MINKNEMNNLRDAIAAKANRRSAWGLGVYAYALELVEALEDNPAARLELLEDRRTADTILLNGARNWGDYSWSGYALIYGADICARLCTPSEIKRTRNGERKPNAREYWLDTQARALWQAAQLITDAAKITKRK